jgi:CubicO group peptidase (beta-lactamase class C family)
VLSTADLNKFVQALFNGTLLTPAELQEMLKPMVKADTMPGDMSYGLGVYVGTDPAGNKVVSQVDVRQGFGAYWAYYPDSKLTVIVMNNLTDWANQPYRVRDVGLLLARVILAAK